MKSASYFLPLCKLYRRAKLPVWVERYRIWIQLMRQRESDSSGGMAFAWEYPMGKAFLQSFLFSFFTFLIEWIFLYVELVFLAIVAVFAFSVLNIVLHTWRIVLKRFLKKQCCFCFFNHWFSHFTCCRLEFSL